MCVSSRETPVAYTTLFLSLWVVGDRDPGLAGGPERRQPGGGQLQLRASTQEELGVPRHCPGPTTLDVGHAELVEQTGDRELVGDRQGQRSAERRVGAGRST